MRVACEWHTNGMRVAYEWNASGRTERVARSASSAGWRHWRTTASSYSTCHVWEGVRHVTGDHRRREARRRKTAQRSLMPGRCGGGVGPQRPTRATARPTPRRGDGRGGCSGTDVGRAEGSLQRQQLEQDHCAHHSQGGRRGVGMSGARWVRRAA
eukprot:6578472-Prymnesium_polylepis.1